MELFSKREASKDGLNYQCKTCAKAVTKAWTTANQVKVRVYSEDHREKARATTRAWKLDNPLKPKAWQQANKDKVNNANAKRRAAKLQRTPSWVADSEWQQFALEEMYSATQDRERITGVVHHVDHIIPLQGELVSGFHVVENLQVITAYENISKNNSYEVC